MFGKYFQLFKTIFTSVIIYVTSSEAWTNDAINKRRHYFQDERSDYELLYYYFYHFNILV